MSQAICIICNSIVPICTESYLETLYIYTFSIISIYECLWRQCVSVSISSLRLGDWSAYRQWCIERKSTLCGCEGTDPAAHCNCCQPSPSSWSSGAEVPSLDFSAGRLDSELVQVNSYWPLLTWDTVQNSKTDLFWYNMFNTSKSTSCECKI